MVVLFFFFLSFFEKKVRWKSSASLLTGWFLVFKDLYFVLLCIQVIEVV